MLGQPVRGRPAGRLGPPRLRARGDRGRRSRRRRRRHRQDAPAGRPTTRSRKVSSRSATSSRGRTTAARPGPNRGSWPTAATSSTRARASSRCPTAALLCTFETFKTYDDPGVWRYTGGALRSDDGGRTWGPPVISAASDPDGDPHDTMWWDPRIARLASGELVQCYYAFRHATRTEGPVHIAWSPDDGATWTRRRPRPDCRARRPIPCPSPTAGCSSSSSAGRRPRRWSRSSRTTAAERSTGHPS